MRYEASTPDEYIQQIPEDRKEAFSMLRQAINSNIPEGFEETINYNMPGWVVPHSIYPDGYHCDPKLPLPFMSLASQKNFIAVYHMGIYADPELMTWFTQEFSKHCKRKLDMGKSCIRFKWIDDIPFELIGELSGKMTAEDWIEIYEDNVKNRKR